MGATAFAFAQRIPPQALSAAWTRLANLPVATGGAAVTTDGTTIFHSHGAISSGTVQQTARTITTAGVINTATAPGTGRNCPASAWCNGRHWVISGGTPGTQYATVEAYTPGGTNGVAGTWSSATSLPGSALRSGAAGASIGDFVYVAGGSNDVSASAPNNPTGQSSFNTFYRLNTITGTWSTLATMPAARTLGALVPIGSKLYYLGGLDSTGSYSSSVFVFDTTTGTWSTATALSGTSAARSGVAVGSVIYLPQTTVTRSYDTASGTTDTLAPTTSTSHGTVGSAALIGTSVYFMGGSITALDVLDLAAITELTGNPSPYVQKLRAARNYLARADPIAAAIAGQLPETMPTTTDDKAKYVRNVALVKALALAGPG